MLGWLKGLLGGNVASTPAPELLEQLEQRLVLAPTPFPALTALENQDNPVVRIETNFGDVDIELFQTAAPITVANFLRYVTSGRLDETFFHRSVNNFVVQGGGFSYREDRADRLQRVETDPPIIREQSGRSNLARTVAMARTNDLNSATSQFFINTVDNPGLDTTSGGYTVFGRVINGWENVQTIAGLQIRNLTDNPFFAGDNAGAMGEVPVGQFFNPGNVRNSDLVQLIDAEVIKPGGTRAFYDFMLMFPEGRAGAGASEQLELYNPNGREAAFQVRVRYESGQRDQVILTGTIPANQRRVITLSSGTGNEISDLRAGVSYAVFVDSAITGSNTLPVSGAWQRTEYGATSKVSLFRPFRYADADLQAWSFPLIERSPLSTEFLHLQNLADTTADVTIALVTVEGATTRIVRSIEPYRKLTLNVADLFPGFTGSVSVFMSSSRTIAASVGDWDLPAPGVTGQAATPGWMSMGNVQGAISYAALSQTIMTRGHINRIGLVNPNTSDAVVRFQVIPLSVQTAQRRYPEVLIRVPAQGRADYVLTPGSTRGLALGQRFSLRYIATVPVAAAFNTAQTTGRYAPATTPAVGALVPFQHEVGQRTVFAGGYTDPRRQGTTPGRSSEVLSLWSPFRDPRFNLTYTLSFTFADGTSLTTSRAILRYNTRVDINPARISAVASRIRANPVNQNYAVTVVWAVNVSGQTVDAGGVAQLTRFDRATGNLIYSTNGQNVGELFKLDNPGFQSR